MSGLQWTIVIFFSSSLLLHYYYYYIVLQVSSMEDINALIYLKSEVTRDSKEGNEETEENPLCLREKYDIS